MHYFFIDEYPGVSSIVEITREEATDLLLAGGRAHMYFYGKYKVLKYED